MKAAFCLGLLLSFSLVTAAPAKPEKHTKIECPGSRGVRPLVETSKTAREIFAAVLHGQGARLSDYSEVRVEDGGDHWEVYQYDPATIGKSDSGVDVLSVTTGGGLATSINKCNGAIFAHWQK